MGIKKCSFCKISSSDEIELCPVCGINKSKTNKNELEKDEIKRNYFCRAIRVVAILLTLLGAFKIYLLPHFLQSNINVIIIQLLLGILQIITGIGLYKYKYWSYYMAIPLYVILFLLSLTYPFTLTSIGIQSIIWLLPLYYIANSKSRKFFSRKYAN